MFNIGQTTRAFKPMKVLGGSSPGDHDSYRTMYCGKNNIYFSGLT